MVKLFVCLAIFLAISFSFYWNDGCYIQHDDLTPQRARICWNGHIVRDPWTQEIIAVKKCSVCGNVTDALLTGHYVYEELNMTRIESLFRDDGKCNHGEHPSVWM